MIPAGWPSTYIDLAWLNYHLKVRWYYQTSPGR